MVGYSTSGHKMFDPAKKSVTASCDVKFFEEKLYKNYQMLEDYSRLPLADGKEIAITSEEQQNTEDDIQNIAEITVNSAEIPVSDKELLLFGEFTMACVAIANFPTAFQKEGRRLSNFIPRTFSAAMTCRFSEEWIAAIDREFTSHKEKNSWELVEKTREKANIACSLVSLTRS